MKSPIFIITLMSILFSSEFTLAPIVYANYESSGGTWNVEDEPVGLAGWGFSILGEISNFKIELDAYNNRFFGMFVYFFNSFKNDKRIWCGAESAGWNRCRVRRRHQGQRNNLNLCARSSAG